MDEILGINIKFSKSKLDTKLDKIRIRYFRQIIGLY